VSASMKIPPRANYNRNRNYDQYNTVHHLSCSLSILLTLIQTPNQIVRLLLLQPPRLRLTATCLHFSENGNYSFHDMGVNARPPPWKNLPKNS
jgi:hypothetical protein